MGHSHLTGDNLKGNWRETIGIAIGIGGVGNLRGGQQASEGESLKGN